MYPKQYISISIDGTDKFPSGYPHFFEKTKGDDKGTRLKLHVIIVIVHGSSPYVYLATESLKSDPNLFCEVLTLTLQAEEKKRGRLPDTLFLQLDNCWRENKNTYSEKYLEWLCERGVHRIINVGFLPVGHTHFDPDQLASRIGKAIQHGDITCIEKLLRVIEGSFTPSPTVTFIDDVMDWRELVNPGINLSEQAAECELLDQPLVQDNGDVIDHRGTKVPKKTAFPVGTSMCRQMRGICTKELKPGREEYMSESSPLHWKIQVDCNGHVFLQTRATRDDELWSEAVYHWDTTATRPEGRECHINASGLLPSDLKYAPRKRLTNKRLVELTRTLAGAKPRLSTAHWEEVQRTFEALKNPPNVSGGRDWSFVHEVYTTHYTLHTTHYTLHTTHYTLHRVLKKGCRRMTTSWSCVLLLSTIIRMSKTRLVKDDKVITVVHPTKFLLVTFWLMFQITKLTPPLTSETTSGSDLF
jgi:hypothetical protein